jgi:hypothetical protein
MPSKRELPKALKSSLLLLIASSAKSFSRMFSDGCRTFCAGKKFTRPLIFWQTMMNLLMNLYGHFFKIIWMVITGISIFMMDNFIWRGIENMSMLINPAVLCLYFYIAVSTTLFATKRFGIRVPFLCKSISPAFTPIFVSMSCYKFWVASYLPVSFRYGWRNLLFASTLTKAMHSSGSFTHCVPS